MIDYIHELKVIYEKLSVIRKRRLDIVYANFIYRFFKRNELNDLESESFFLHEEVDRIQKLLK